MGIPVTGNRKQGTKIRPKKRWLYEVPYTEIVKSGTIRLASALNIYYTIPAFDPLQTVSLSEDEAVGGGAGSGSQQNRLFRNVAAATVDSGAPFVPPSYPAGHYDHHDHGYSYQTFNGQYVNTG